MEKRVITNTLVLERISHFFGGVQKLRERSTVSLKARVRNSSSRKCCPISRLELFITYDPHRTKNLVEAADFLMRKKK